jgi:hypothetical protein
VPTPAPMPVPMGAIGGRTGLGGKFLEGGNEIISALFYLYFFSKKKKIAEDRRTWHIPRHLRDYCSITKVMGVSLLQNACQV